jgi:hypothetical protein
MRTQWFVHGVLAVWACLMIVIGSSLMVGHWVPLPRPAVDDAAWSANLADIRTDEASGRWAVLHFLYAECPCSRRVLEHVIEQPPRDGVAERIILIGSDTALSARAERQGYEVDSVSPDELKSKYGVEAAPLLVVSDPDGTPRYAGGYTSRKQGPDFQDRHIIADLMAGHEVEPLPLYGCAVSQRLQGIVDPLGLKSNNKSFSSLGK